MTSASGPDVGVFDAADQRPLFRVPVGRRRSMWRSTAASRT